MPRGARLDAPGTLHHVMVRGIEGNSIVEDDSDRNYFVTRLGIVAAASGTNIYAWALMTNHAHILLKSGPTGLSSFMRKLLTGYASYYNRRYKRHGHLFQNRYKSIVCDENAYFLKLVSYIHLNPLRAGLVCSLDELERYPWCGHAVIMKMIRRDWQERAYVLGCFGDQESSACKTYREYVASECGLGRQPGLTGGGLTRSLGGWSEVKGQRQRGEKSFSDERILGSEGFVKEILKEAEEHRKTRFPAIPLELEAQKRLDELCREAGVSLHALQGGSRNRTCSSIRRQLVREYVEELGMSYAGAARLLGVSASAVTQMLLRK